MVKPVYIFKKSARSKTGTKVYHGFHIRLIAILTVLMMIPVFSLFLYSRTNIINTVDLNRSYLAQLNLQTQANLNTMFESVDRATRAHMYDTEMSGILSRDHRLRDGSWIQDMTRIERHLQSVIAMSPHIFSIVYINLHGQEYSSLALQPSYIESIREEIQNIDWSQTDFYLSLPSKRAVYQSELDFISYIKPVQSAYTFRPIGHICIDLAYEPFKKYFNASIDPNQVSHFLILADKTVIYDSVQATGDQNSKFDPLLSQENELDDEAISLILNDQPIIDVANNRLIVEWSRHEPSGWLVVHYAFYDDLVSMANEANQLIIAIIGTVILVSFLISLLLTKKMVRPLNQLHHAMTELKQGNFIKVPESSVRDEIGIIISNYNDMVEQLNEHIITQYQMRLRQTQTELKMLQYQINPHFLYNTLNLISAKAELEDNIDIARISNKLSSLFRYNLNASSTVKLEEDVEQTKRYLDIQKMRFPGKFNTLILIEPEISDYVVPRFLLQPLVENAMYHGLENLSSEGLIVLAASIVEDRLDIRVVDNGRGIDPEKLEKLNQALKSDENSQISSDDQFGIGLINVNNRIHAFFGYQYGLFLYSIVGEGTEVRISLPCTSEIDNASET